MKGIILSIKNNKAAVLLKDGKIINTGAKEGWENGIEVELRLATPNFIRMSAAAVAATFLLSIAAYAYYTPVASVSMDINPSVELSVNMFDRIISAQANNPEDTELLKTTSLANIDIADGAKVLLERNPNLTTNSVKVSVSNAKKARQEKLRNKVEAVVKQHIANKKKQVETMLDELGTDGIKKAREIGVSPYKYYMMKKVIESKPNYTEANLKVMPLKDLTKLFREIK